MARRADAIHSDGEGAEGSQPPTEPASKGGARRVVHNLALSPSNLSPHSPDSLPAATLFRRWRGAERIALHLQVEDTSRNFGGRPCGAAIHSPPSATDYGPTVRSQTPDIKSRMWLLQFHGVDVQFHSHWLKIPPATGDRRILDLVRST